MNILTIGMIIFLALLYLIYRILAEIYAQIKKLTDIYSYDSDLYNQKMTRLIECSEMILDKVDSIESSTYETSETLRQMDTSSGSEITHSLPSLSQTT
ncbi:hypothetical protein [Lelliottia wanjuensis]|uniref:hypothetical protein n=1 Tax=Lelliottia wanjuensis TaxID=3050585 RepID=UPI00254A2C25|nr:hypothetical protein [Lelliottia sp. V104_15]MDK9605517.1 hypothetical protein [Lelliottia sp. V104_15]